VEEMEVSNRNDDGKLSEQSAILRLYNEVDEDNDILNLRQQQANKNRETVRQKQ
ncbi:unnamed protein product, partial [Didymodactylos carnosus]